VTPDQVVRSPPLSAQVVTEVNTALSAPWTPEEQAYGRFLPTSMYSTCKETLIDYYTKAGWVIIHIVRNGEPGLRFARRPTGYGVRED
jgi:hypothetical protein